MTLTESLISELTRESATTRRVLERIPEDQLTWKPHPKSKTIGELALHVASLPWAIGELLSELSRDLPNVPQREPESLAEVLAMLDKGIASATAKLSAWGDQGLMETFKLTRNGKPVIELPRGAAVRAIMLNHAYHHRGQLTVYLRLLDVPLPAVYGASADEQPFG